MSMAVLSDSIDSGIDVVTSVMARYSVKMSHQPPDENHAYGHGKFENLSGLIQAFIVLVIALFIISEAIRRMTTGIELRSIEFGIIIMVVSVVAKFAISQNMIRVARKHESIAMEANALNLRADIWLSTGVLVSLSMILLLADKYPMIVYLDPIVAIIIGLMIIKTGFDIAKRSGRDLLDEQIPESEQQMVCEVLREYSGEFLEFHNFRARRAGNHRHIDMHLVVSKNKSVEEAHDLTEEIEKAIERRLKNATVMIHVEPCDGKCQECEKKE